MGKVNYSPQILSIIIAIKSYKKFIVADYIARDFKEKDFDWYDKVQDYFKELKLPNNLKHNKETLDYILNVPDDMVELYSRVNGNKLKEFVFINN